MTKAPENIILGCKYDSFANDPVLEEGNTVTLQFGIGTRDRSIRYVVKELKKDCDKITYLHLERKKGL